MKQIQKLIILIVFALFCMSLSAKPLWNEIDDRVTYRYMKTSEDGTIIYGKKENWSGEEVLILARVKGGYLMTSNYIRQYKSNYQAERRFWEISSNYLANCIKWEKPEEFGYIFVYDGFTAVVYKRDNTVQVIHEYE